MAVAMMARLELVTVSVKPISLEHHARSVFLQNMAEIAQMASPSLRSYKTDIVPKLISVNPGLKVNKNINFFAV